MIKHNYKFEDLDLKLERIIEDNPFTDDDYEKYSEENTVEKVSFSPNQQKFHTANSRSIEIENTGISEDNPYAQTHLSNQMNEFEDSKLNRSFNHQQQMYQAQKEINQEREN